jgi:hypothetical protein
LQAIFEGFFVMDAKGAEATVGTGGLIQPFQGWLSMGGGFPG